MRDILSGRQVICAITLGVTFPSRTFTKTINGQIGEMNSGWLRECEGGGATLLTETLPWRVLYGGFIGSLPNMIGFYIRVVGMGIRISPSGGVTCLGTSTVSDPAEFRLDLVERETQIAGIRALNEGGIPISGLFCSSGDYVKFNGQGEVYTGSETRVRLRLV